MSLQAITLAQPWPRMMLLDDGPKRIENRDWSPPRRLIGQHLALHGGRGPKGKADQGRLRDELDEINLQIWNGEADPEEWEGERVLDWCVPGIYAVAKLARVVQQSDDPWFFGAYGWVLEEFTPIDPVPCKGKQGLWPVEGELLDEVRRRWQAARKAAVRESPSVPLPAQVEPVGAASDLPDLAALADRSHLRGPRYRRMIPDPMGAAQQAAVGQYLLDRLPVAAYHPKAPYRDLYLLTKFARQVLGLPGLPHWRAMTPAQAVTVMEAAQAQAQGRAT